MNDTFTTPPGGCCQCPLLGSCCGLAARLSRGLSLSSAPPSSPFSLPPTPHPRENSPTPQYRKDKAEPHAILSRDRKQLKLQALVYDIRPPSIAIIDNATVSKNCQLTNRWSNGSTFVTDNSNRIGRLFYN